MQYSVHPCYATVTAHKYYNKHSYKKKAMNGLLYGLGGFIAKWMHFKNKEKQETQVIANNDNYNCCQFLKTFLPPLEGRFRLKFYEVMLLLYLYVKNKNFLSTPLEARRAEALPIGNARGALVFLGKFLVFCIARNFQRNFLSVCQLFDIAYNIGYYRLQC